MLSRREFLKSTLGTGVALATGFSQEAAAQPARRRLIVDAQVHMWKASTPDRPWVPGARPQLPEPFTIERLVPMMDEAGVDRVVIVPPTLEGERLDYAQEAVKRYPGRFAIMGRKRACPDSVRRVQKFKDRSGQELPRFGNSRNGKRSLKVTMIDYRGAEVCCAGISALHKSSLARGPESLRILYIGSGVCDALRLFEQ